ncbi:scavenger receptor class B member 1 isoform X2 [Toxorhynchites rutilus septentrionalis]|uniref:scavenger receptor class B member 1 isoform X2 n=1 Tax=Toxorhynchites rutilus septentrionalis TaxID=329112 RepID=UPI0024790A1E|nr:scavenger receptor class B member 1 isoform X2 [Toxorhynchites rutilus septentrionalis]
MLGIRYNSVHTNNCESGTNESLSTNRRNLIRQFSVVDSFFHQRKAGDTARQPKSVFILMAVGLLLIATGITSHLLQPYVLIFKWLIFEKGGEIFELWKTPPVDLYVKIYLFNVTNAREYLRGDADKMTFEEVGPYVYRELLSHENVTFLNNGTLYTKPSHPLVFQEHLSNGHKEEDVFFVPNIALLSIAQVASRQSYLLRLPLNLLIRQTKISALEQQTAKQFMFGFETTLTTLGNTFLPNWITFNKVGLIDRMYDFDDDFETIYTGETDESLSGLYDSYLGSPNLPQWDGDHCSSIRKASDGTKFKSFIKDDDQLLFFRKSMCRPQRMVQAGTNFEVDGLQATKFVFEENALDNGEVDTKNKCFCRKGKCLPRGLIDVTDCYYGFPIALSYPHFYDADPKLLTRLNGLSPNKTLHSSFFMINSLSGLPLQLSVKFQINMAVDDISNIAECERFSNLVIPALWFEITMLKLPQSLQSRFLFYLYYLRIFDRIMYYSFFVCGGLLLLLSVLRVSFSLSKSVSSFFQISGSEKKQFGMQDQKLETRRSSMLKNNCSRLEQGSEQERENFLL